MQVLYFALAYFDNMFILIKIYVIDSEMLGRFGKFLGLRFGTPDQVPGEVLMTQEYTEAVQKSAREILDARFGKDLEAYKKQKHYKKPRKTALKIIAAPKQLSAKELGQIIWHSFRCSSGNVALQFSMLYKAYTYYGHQETSEEEVAEVFLQLLKIGQKHTETMQWEEPKWRPPHPRINRITREVRTDIGLSLSGSHTEVYSSEIKKFTKDNPLVKMLLRGQGSIERFDGDGTYSIGRKQEHESVEGVLEQILRTDFEYLLKEDTNYIYEEIPGNPYRQQKVEKSFPGRPNRDPKYDGSNTLKDRYFSYFVWFILKDNTSGNEFFDVYFGILRKYFKEWFQHLPKDGDMRKYYHSLRTSHDLKGELTQEDVLYFITQYNITHPETEFDIVGFI